MCGNRVTIYLMFFYKTVASVFNIFSNIISLISDSEKSKLIVFLFHCICFTKNVYKTNIILLRINTNALTYQNLSQIIMSIVLVMYTKTIILPQFIFYYLYHAFIGRSLNLQAIEKQPCIVSIFLSFLIMSHTNIYVRKYVYRHAKLMTTCYQLIPNINLKKKLRKMECKPEIQPQCVGTKRCQRSEAFVRYFLKHPETDWVRSDCGVNIIVTCQCPGHDILCFVLLRQGRRRKCSMFLLTLDLKLYFFWIKIT